MKKYVTVSISMEIHNEQDFRRAAYLQAQEDGLDESEASEYLDVRSLGDCALMLFDKKSPNGCQVTDSGYDNF